MRRTVSILAVAVVVLTAFLFSYEPADACHGNCYVPCNGCYLEGAAEPSTENGRMPVAGADALLQATPTREELCQLGQEDAENFPGATVNLVGFSHREFEAEQGQDQNPDQPLCLIQILLDPGNDPASLSTSLVDPGEATIFHVRQGVMQFEVDDEEEAAGFLRVLPMDGDDTSNLEALNDGTGTFLAEVGDIFTISAGASIYLDNQPEKVALIYRHADGDPAELLIASEPPVGGAEGTPEP